MSLPVMRPDGRLRIPVRLEAEDGTVGDGWVDVSPGEPGWDQYIDEYRAKVEAVAADPYDREL